MALTELIKIEYNEVTNYYQNTENVVGATTITGVRSLPTFTDSNAWFVSKVGSDGDTGLSSAPFLTITKAMSSIASTVKRYVVVQDSEQYEENITWIVSCSGLYSEDGQNPTITRKWGCNSYVGARTSNRTMFYTGAGTVIYVSANSGDDTYNGSINSPYASLTKAFSTVAASGDCVEIKDNAIYLGNFDIRAFGDVTIQASSLTAPILRSNSTNALINANSIGAFLNLYGINFDGDGQASEVVYSNFLNIYDSDIYGGSTGIKITDVRTGIINSTKIYSCAVGINLISTTSFNGKYLIENSKIYDCTIGKNIDNYYDSYLINYSHIYGCESALIFKHNTSTNIVSLVYKNSEITSCYINNSSITIINFENSPASSANFYCLFENNNISNNIKLGGSTRNIIGENQGTNTRKIKGGELIYRKNYFGTNSNSLNGSLVSNIFVSYVIPSFSLTMEDNIFYKNKCQILRTIASSGSPTYGFCDNFIKNNIVYGDFTEGLSFEGNYFSSSSLTGNIFSKIGNYAIFNASGLSITADRCCVFNVPSLGNTLTTFTNIVTSNPIFFDILNGQLGISPRSDCKLRGNADGTIDIGTNDYLLEISSDSFEINGFNILCNPKNTSGVKVNSGYNNFFIKNTTITSVMKSNDFLNNILFNNVFLNYGYNGIFLNNSSNSINNSIFNSNNDVAIYINANNNNITNVTVLNNKYGIYENAALVANVSNNNIFYNQSIYSIYGQLIANNCIITDGLGNTATAGNSVLTNNPLFISDTEPNFNLRTIEGGFAYDSPAKNLGDDSNDAGAYTVVRSTISTSFNSYTLEENPITYDEFLMPIKLSQGETADGGFFSTAASIYKKIIEMSWGGDNHYCPQDQKDAFEIIYRSETTHRIYPSPVSSPSYYISAKLNRSQPFSFKREKHLDDFDDFFSGKLTWRET